MAIARPVDPPNLNSSPNFPAIATVLSELMSCSSTILLIILSLDFYLKTSVANEIHDFINIHMTGMSFSLLLLNFRKVLATLSVKDSIFLKCTIT